MSRRVHETGQYALLQTLAVMYVRQHGGAVELTQPQVEALEGQALSVRHDPIRNKVIVTLEHSGRQAR